MEDSKTSEKPISPEIVKLTEKLASDPKSKLFVSLAEEYIKAGMLDEAQLVLEDGLKLHPNFMSAKTTLGKVYFEKGQLQEAKTLFEGLIAASPDNLFAHRRLARIYHEEGRFEEARKSCRAVLAVNPKDEEMNALMQSIGQAPPDKTDTPVPPPAAEVSSHFEATAQPEGPARKEMAEEPPQEHRLEATRQSSEPETASSSDQTERIVVDEMHPAPSEPEPAVKPESGTEPPREIPRFDSEERDFAVPAGPAEAEAKGGGAQAPPEDKPFAWSGEDPETPAVQSGEGELATESLADLYIKQGYYDKGKDIYQRILARDPANSAVARKLEETEALLSILSKSAASAPGVSPVPEIPPDSGRVESAGQESSKPEEGRTTTDRRVKRLEAWLDSLRKGQQK